ncbi:1-acyl-sn-glycerol-3-phosphate acyltransferase [Janibacter sp. G56]|uniref:lysophospholipid acyltransferase family protein n=1 Tax=Janibacter sp. G56 TaxID=3418717 RepID=UPI003D0182E4
MATSKKTVAAPTPAARKSAATKATAAKKSTTKKAATPKAAAATKATAAQKAAAGKGTTKKVATRGAFAAGAARASGERARRAHTPLLAETASKAAEQAAPASGPTAPAATTAAPAAKSHRPSPRATPVATKRTAATSGAARRTRSATERRPAPAKVARARRSAKPAVDRPLSVVPDAPATSAPSAPVTAQRPDRSSASGYRPEPLRPASTTASLATDGGDMVQVLIASLRMAASSIGWSTDEAERQIAALLAFLRRRLTGDYEVDEFGFDRDFTNEAFFPLMRPLYRHWFHIEVRGIENIPSDGGALIVSNHSGTVALDSLMVQLAIHDEHPQHRFLRMLGADLVFSLPVVGDVARKTGATLATNPDAERLLSSGELVGVWPEGFKGVGKPFRERYKLQRFGRGGFVSAALRSGVPIIPCSVVGAEEIYPMIGNLRSLARLFGLPYVPITPTFPLLGPLGLIPLPSKWIIEFGAPVDTASMGAEAADDPMLVFDLTDQVRETIQQTLYSLLMSRRSTFF